MDTHTVRLRRNAALKSSIASLCSFSFIISTSKCSHYIIDQLNSQREGGHWLTEQGPMGTLSFYIHINSWAGVTKILLLTAHLFFSYLKHFWCFHTKPLVQNWVRLTFDIRESAWKGTWVSTDDVNSIFCALCVALITACLANEIIFGAHKQTFSSVAHKQMNWSTFVCVLSLAGISKGTSTSIKCWNCVFSSHVVT